MSAKERDRKEAIEQGMQKGVQQEKFSIAKTMLAKSYDPSEVKTLTGISQDVMRQISA